MKYLNRFVARIARIAGRIKVLLLKILATLVKRIRAPSWLLRVWNDPRCDSLRHRAQAWHALWQRYREHFAHSWSHRHDLKLPDLRAHEAEFLPAALALQNQPISHTGRLIAKVIMALLAFVLLWVTFGKMDIIVNASGKIIPAERTKIIASAETARVDRIFVEEGQPVNAGDTLIELDTRMVNYERAKAIGDRDSARLQVARSQALLASIESNQLIALPPLEDISAERTQEAQKHLESQWREFLAKRKRFDSEVSRYQSQLPLITQRAKDYQSLAKDRDVSLHAWQEKEQEKIEIEGKLAEARNQRNSFIAEAQKNARDALNDASRMAAGANQDALRASAHADLLKLTSPVDGTVQQLTVHTVGGVVPAAQPLMIIVPKQDHIEIEAFIENKDIGFVRDGQSAQVKIEAFDYSKYGTVSGRVTNVSRDAIDPNDNAAKEAIQANKDQGKKGQPAPRGALYSVKVVLDKNHMIIDGKKILLTPGMTASIELKTGERRIIEYFLSPLIVHTRESLNER